MLWMSKTIENKQMSGADDDLEYVEACRKGDTEAFAVLVGRHSQKMLDMAYRMLGDYDDACDVTQEAFLAAFRAIGRFKAEAKFSTWLYRIVINYAKNRLQQRQRLSRHEGVASDETADGRGVEALCPREQRGIHPGELLERRELEAQVQKCISTLPGDYRDVLVMRDIQGFSYEEIRDILQIPDGTVKSRLTRARLSMKDCLKRIMGEV